MTPAEALAEIERAITTGAATALRKRARRQAGIAAAETVVNEKGAVVRSGEGAIAEMLARVFAELADEIERDG